MLADGAFHQAVDVGDVGDVLGDVGRRVVAVGHAGDKGDDERWGTDLFNASGLPPTSAAEDRDERALSRVLTVDGWVAVTPDLAAEHSWERGDTLLVSSGASKVPLVIGALVDFQRFSPLASRKLALMEQRG